MKPDTKQYCLNKLNNKIKEDNNVAPQPLKSQSNSIINLLMCTDQNMVVPMIVTLTSIVNTLENSEKINAYIFTKGINKSYQKRIEKKFPNGEINFYWEEFRDIRIESLALRNRREWPAIAFYRIILGDLLPDYLSRIIYLDADTLVCKSISYLYNTQLDNAIIGAVTDLNQPWLGMQRGCIPARRMGIPANAPYFNSGVMVIDISRFRAEKIGERALNYATHYAEELNFPDQDALNVSLFGFWKQIDPRWNQLPSIYLEHGIVNCQLNIEELTQIRRDPWIIHFTGALPRPWFHPHGHPLANRWIKVYKTINLSGFKLYKFKQQSRKKVVKLLDRLSRAISTLIFG